MEAWLLTPRFKGTGLHGRGVGLGPLQKEYCWAQAQSHCGAILLNREGEVAIPIDLDCRALSQRQLLLILKV